MLTAGKLDARVVALSSAGLLIRSKTNTCVILRL